MEREDFSTFNTDFPEQIAPVLHKMLAGEPLSDAELSSLEQWKNLSPANAALMARLQDPAAVQGMLQQWYQIEKNRETQKERGLRKVLESLGHVSEETPVIPIWRRKTFRYAAAVIVVVLSVGAYFWRANQPAQLSLADQTEEIAPGRNGAVLTLADGSEVVLDSMGNGIVATQGGAQAILKNGQLAYDQTGTSAGIAYNTIHTPKGRQFTLTLPDGSKVWMNAASTLKYPTVFAGKERVVQLEGEAYFEIAKNAAMPFAVSARNGTKVEVLGTSFNINSYVNESAISTTLLDGAVRVRTDAQQQTLKPGQQGVVNANGELKVVQADMDKVMAWKNGIFNFEDATLQEVMRQLERWYDIEVIYAKGIPVTRFGGEINKQNSLQEVLQILEKSNVHFRLEEGRRLIVMP